MIVVEDLDSWSKALKPNQETQKKIIDSLRNEGKMFLDTTRDRKRFELCVSKIELLNLVSS